MLTKAAGPACLLLVVLSRGIRLEPAVAVKPAAALALAALILEPAFTAFILSNNALGAGSGLGRGGGGGVIARGGVGARLFFGRSRKGEAAAAAAAAAMSAVNRVRWLTAGAQLALWAAVTLAYARLSLRCLRSREGSRRTVASYLAALRALAVKKRGNGSWVRFYNRSSLSLIHI